MTFAAFRSCGCSSSPNSPRVDRCGHPACSSWAVCVYPAFGALVVGERASSAGLQRLLPRPATLPRTRALPGGSRNGEWGCRGAKSSSEDSMDPWIVSDPDTLAGKPRVRGTRLSVAFLLDLFAAGAARDQILAAYPYLPAEGLDAALRYAADRRRGVGHPRPGLTRASVCVSAARRREHLFRGDRRVAAPWVGCRRGRRARARRFERRGLVPVGRRRGQGRRAPRQ